MGKYLFRRSLGAVVVMWAVATLVFFMLRAVPGDPLLAMVFDTGDPEAAEEMRRAFGLDQPLYVQYFKYFVQALQGNFGASIYGSRVPVSQIVKGVCTPPQVAIESSRVQAKSMTLFLWSPRYPASFPDLRSQKFTTHSNLESARLLTPEDAITVPLRFRSTFHPPRKVLLISPTCCPVSIL